ncbi:MAG: hypothetical protein V3U35_00840 [Candidatus Neomarinimicrobiota bacterium]
MTSTKQLFRPVITQIDRVRQRLERWRRTRKKRSRIPEGLWNAAVQLAGRYGVNKTAQSLRLNYYELKKRLDAAPRAAPVGREPIASFVELASPALVPECLVELESPSGTKMRIHLKGTAAPDLALLSSLFREAES